MSDLNPKLIAILAKYSPRSATSLTAATALAELEIDILDIPMLYLDVEDAFEVQIRFDDESALATAGGLQAWITAQQGKPRRRAPVPLSNRPWMSA